MIKKCCRAIKNVGYVPEANCFKGNLFDFIVSFTTLILMLFIYLFPLLVPFFIKSISRELNKYLKTHINLSELADVTEILIKNRSN
jgi:uncharacterized BrkB/YihY/UPF0761 family membrane protein